MESVEDVIIVGAGLAGLATALGLHRKGIKSLVLESADSLRATGFALTVWTNAWKALDALGVGDSLRHNLFRLQRGIVISTASGDLTSEVSYTSKGTCGKHEARCVNREVLLETLSNELPKGTIRYSSKLVSIEEDSANNIKLLHLADGSTLKTKVLIGCDGVNSMVARWLGLKNPSLVGRTASRGLTTYPNGHGRNQDLVQYIGHGFRFGFIPCDDKNIYWYITWTTCEQDKDMEGNPTKMKQYVLNKLRMSDKVPEDVLQLVDKSEMGTVASSPLKFRSPFELIWGNISKGNVCLAGDALHPMTPDLGQGGCSALEDGVVLARCLGNAILLGDELGEYVGIKEGLEKYANERRWRSFKLIAIAYVWGAIQERDGMVMRYFRDNLLAQMMADVYLKSADFDCGEL